MFVHKYTIVRPQVHIHKCSHPEARKLTEEGVQTELEPPATQGLLLDARHLKPPSQELVPKEI